MRQIFNYDVYVFDCDGVILDSNQLKIDAMEIALKTLTADSSQINLCIDYFRHNFGRSRFHHVDVFIDKYLTVADEEDANKTRVNILDAYSSQCCALYLLADMTPGFIEFIEQLKGKKYVASGSEQEELMGVFRSRGLDKYFEGVYGSPTKKTDLVSNILNIESSKKVLMFGDAVSDFEAAKLNNIDFIGYLPYSNVAGIMQDLANTHGFLVLNEWPRKSKDIN